jgi:hypothetical protein
MKNKLLILSLLVVSAVSLGASQGMDMNSSENGMDSGNMAGMKMSQDGMVMGQNTDQLPPGCDSIAGEENLTIRAGREHADQFNGKLFTYDQRVYEYDPCTKLTVTFHNSDNVRHQWMVHGLPQSLYRMGMFNIEVSGPGNMTGTFILPSQDETLLVHCGVPQHMQKGMKAQLKVGAGDGDISNIPGVTGDSTPYEYPEEDNTAFVVMSTLTAVVFGVLSAAGIRRWNR